MNNPKSQIPNPKSQIGYGDYLRFRNLILEYSGLYFPEKKRADLELGLSKALNDSSLLTIEDGYNLDRYYALLSDRTNPLGKAELDRLINYLTIGETHFFRDEPQCDALYNQVLPELIARKRAAALAVGPAIQPQLRIWSAGCATGEEAYSIAILLKELIVDIDNWHILILATDINHDSLIRAKEAVYSDWSFRENRAKRLRPRYFSAEPLPTGNTLTKNRYRLDETIRSMVTFTSLNLIEDDYPAIHNNTVSMDLVLCRNVTIYFTQETTQLVINRFYDGLVQGGWLVVGHSEPALWIYRAFQARPFPGTLLYQKTGQPQLWPAGWESPKTANGPVKATAPFKPDRALLSPPPSRHPAALPPANAAPNLPTSQPPNPLLLYQKAQQQLQAGQTEQVIHRLQELVLAQPGFAPAYILLGRAYANLGHWAQAKRWCESGLKLDTLSAESYHLLALIYQNEEQLDQAIFMLKKAIYLEREAPLYFFNLALLYKKINDPANARRAFLNAAKILAKWPSDKIVTDSGGMTAKELSDLTGQMLRQLPGDGRP